MQIARTALVMRVAVAGTKSVAMLPLQSNGVCTPTTREHAMPHTTVRPDLSLIGEFIEVPAWNTIGQVINEAPATHGSDDAIRVLLQTDPHRPGRSSWFHLEPGQYTVV